MAIKPTHRRVEYVTARQVESSEQIITSNGIVALTPGMYVLESEGQPVRYMDSEEFENSGFEEYTPDSNEESDEESDEDSTKESTPVKKSPTRRPTTAAKG